MEDEVRMLRLVAGAIRNGLGITRVCRFRKARIHWTLKGYFVLLGLHWRSKEAGVAFAFPPVALPAFWKAGKRSDTLHSRVRASGWRNEESFPEVHRFPRANPATKLLFPANLGEQTITK